MIARVVGWSSARRRIVGAVWGVRQVAPNMSSVWAAASVRSLPVRAGPSPTWSGSARGARPVLDQHHREVIVELVGGVFEDGTHQPAQRFGGWQVGQQVPGQQVG
jgi:hypothetical protein